jgi:acylphosphatase
MVEICCKHLFLSGRVQGVSFRASIRRKAKILDVEGWVKNLNDGRVEAVFAGRPKKVENMVDFAREGPRFARVDNIEVNRKEYNDELDGFQIRY